MPREGQMGTERYRKAVDYRGHEKIYGVIDGFMILIVMILQNYTYVKISDFALKMCAVYHRAILLQ